MKTFKKKSGQQFELVDMGDYILLKSIHQKEIKNKEWISRLEERGHRVSRPMKSVLTWGSEFSASEAGNPIEIAILKESFFSGKKCSTKEEKYAEGIRRGWSKAHPDIACYLCETLTVKDFEFMGLQQIIVMSEPFNVDGYGNLAAVIQRRSSDSSGNCLGTYFANDTDWLSVCGVAFVASQG